MLRGPPGGSVPGNLRVLGNIVRQKFQGDETTEHRILGLVDDTHPAAADFSIMR